MTGLHSRSSAMLAHHPKQVSREKFILAMKGCLAARSRKQAFHGTMAFKELLVGEPPGRGGKKTPVCHGAGPCDWQYSRTEPFTWIMDELTIPRNRFHQKAHHAAMRKTIGITYASAKSDHPTFYSQALSVAG
jgi:hypothetical protein